MDVAIPRDRNGEYEPQLIEKYQNTVTQDMEEKILSIVKEWQERPLEKVYAVVFIDAIHYHVRSEGCIVKRAVYITLGIDMNGRKDILGMYVGDRSGVSQNGNTAVHYSSDTKFRKICFLQRHKKTDDRPETYICRTNGRNSFK